MSKQKYSMPLDLDDDSERDLVGQDDMPLDDDYSDGKSDEIGNAYSDADEQDLGDEYEDEPVDEDEDGDDFVQGVHDMDDDQAESAPDQVHGHELNERSHHGLAHNNAQGNLHTQQMAPPANHVRKNSGSGMNAYN